MPAKWQEIGRTERAASIAVAESSFWNHTIQERNSTMRPVPLAKLYPHPINPRSGDKPDRFFKVIRS